jgi:hypothetical protein
MEISPKFMDQENQYPEKDNTINSNLYFQCNLYESFNDIHQIEKSTLKFIWKLKMLPIAKTILSKESNTGGTTIPDFKLYYRAIATKTAWHCHKNGQEDQWDTTENPDINSHSYSHLSFDTTDTATPV